jgi:hypothetical protein
MRVLKLKNPSQPKLIDAVELPVNMGHTKLMMNRERILLSH